MKPAIAWVLVRAHYAASGFDVVEVTSERGQHVYGRKPNGDPTHLHRSNVVARFETAQEAINAICRAQQTMERFGPAVREAEKKASRLQSALSTALHAAARGMPVEEGAFQ